MERQLPAEQGSDRLDRRPGGRHAGERPHHRDAGGDAVPAAGLRADHRHRHSAGPPLEHPAETVDEEVVANVVPAAAVPVVSGDGENDRGRLGGRVGVDALGVVNEGHRHLAERRPGPRGNARRAPAGAGDYRWLGGRDLYRPRSGHAGPGGPGAGGNVDELEAKVATRSLVGP